MNDYEENWDTDEPKIYQSSQSQVNVTESDTYQKRGGGERRNFRRGNFEEQLDISSSVIGLIIGRGGSNIKRTQENYRVFLDVDKQRNTVKISGDNENDVQSALEYLKNQVEGGSSQRQGDERASRGGRSNYQGNREQRDRNGYKSYDNQDNEKNDFYNPQRQGDDHASRGGRSNYQGNRDRNGYKSYDNQDNNEKNDFYNPQRQGDDRASRGGRSNYQGNREQSDRSGYKSYDNYQENNEKNDFYNPPEENDANQEHATIDWDAVNKKSEIERAKRWAQCPVLTKNFYKEHPEVTRLTKEQVATIRANNNNITVARVFKDAESKGDSDDIPNPIWKFEHCFEEYPDLLEEIQKQGFTDPSPIQAQAWPVLLKGEDMIGIAQTGTGKTLAFLLPAMIHTEYQSTPRSERTGPNVLVMAPTRELALQIEKEVNKYSFRGMKAVCVYGGGNRRDQISDVQKGVEIIICTPGRLNDLIQANVIDVNTITYLVLDEADRMLDMGFEPQIRKILLDIRPDRQTIMTSATWPPGVRRLAQSYMNNPIQVCVGTLDLAATHTVTQVVEIVEDDEKYFQIKNFIKNMQPDDKIIIFCGRKTRADDLSSDLTLEGEMCQCIHGSRDQADREQAISDITTGMVKILIATDVASRGLDIEDITHVINFDFPRNIEEYVHRVGRTGRAGRNGVSISFLTRSDWAMAQPLIDILKEAEQVIPEELYQMADRFKAMKDRRANELEKLGDFRGSRGRGGGGGRFDRGHNRR